MRYCNEFNINPDLSPQTKTRAEKMRHYLLIGSCSVNPYGRSPDLHHYRRLPISEETVTSWTITFCGAYSSDDCRRLSRHSLLNRAPKNAVPDGVCNFKNQNHKLRADSLYIIPIHANLVNPKKTSPLQSGYLML